ncbi:PadR family transcriptional regulator [Fructobacillus evanidus]|uniref:PadR family (PadR) n=1 Tax=Fructobacillus evanidus TaxID=3064281 RepID=A0ABN9YKU9_9LACO|nr:DNA-binding transcriptional regulator [Fructobacillus sp. LMG 32999]CAK1221747.1 DNA-binding transcriptional regulator [Fructobacillus sp. LMG 32999]CAK1225843.1 DNA-binding transcriptional regulator [Fructobacillus sp. LMG 32999]CAK1228335.1 DNA-binding transcriptional regulator [Fructobacillus sp. LMG 32999]CAK1228548.1 DNA-binding transcriptional regulator [Fructobacillus sp. LMG 32999]
MKGKDVVLGLLFKKNLTGYELNELIEKRLSHFFDGGFGMIYPTLKKLEKDGLVSKETIIQEGKPNKNIFSITSEGKKEFLQALKTDPDEDKLKSDYLIRFYFGEYLDRNTLIKNTKEQIIRTNEKLKFLTSQIDEWSKDMTKEQYFTYEYGIKHYTSTLDLLNSELKSLENSL